MPVINLLPKVFSIRKDTESGRYYESTKGVYPSVTSILKKSQPIYAQRALKLWEAKVGGPEEAEKIKNAAANRGTLMHEHSERYLLEGVDDSVCPEAAKEYWKSLKPVVQGITEVRMIESPVFHHTLQYAGTVDLVGVYKNKLCLLDWKSADKPKGSLSNLHDYPLQMAAYIGAINQQHRIDGIEIRDAVIAVGVPGITAETFWLNEELILHYWKKWQERRKLYYSSINSRN